MTNEQFLSYKSNIELEAAQIITNEPYLRFGQCIYNTIATQYPDIMAMYIVGRNCDPFYNDNNLPKFWDELQKCLVDE